MELTRLQNTDNLHDDTDQFSITNYIICNAKMFHINDCYTTISMS